MLRSPNRVVGTLAGAAYLVLGIVGLALAGSAVLAGIQILLGAALLLAALSNARASATVNAIVGAALLVLGIVGLFLVGTAGDILDLSVDDNVIHFAGAAVLLAVGLGADRT